MVLTLSTPQVMSLCTRQLETGCVSLGRPGALETQWETGMKLGSEGGFWIGTSALAKILITIVKKIRIRSIYLKIIAHPPL